MPRDAKPYWIRGRTSDGGAARYIEHWLLAEHDSEETGKWEMFCVDYKPDIHHEGGKWLEFYWEGDFQETIPYVPVTNAKFQLMQFIEFWMDENRG